MFEHFVIVAGIVTFGLMMVWLAFSAWVSKQHPTVNWFVIYLPGALVILMTEIVVMLLAIPLFN